MSRSIRIFIQYDKVVFASIENESIPVVFHLNSPAEDAFVHFGKFSHVLLSPGSKDVFHYFLLIMFFRILLGLK